jgi:hypothetical protein
VCLFGSWDWHPNPYGFGVHSELKVLGAKSKQAKQLVLHVSSVAVKQLCS